MTQVSERPNVKQVIVMRKDLNMRKGKMAAQAAHAAMIFLINSATIQPHHLPVGNATHGFGQVLTSSQAQWIEESFVKIVVGVGSEEELFKIHQAALDAGLTSHVVRDAGYTEFDGVPTYTCLAIGPDDSEAIDKVTGHLKLL